jgi:dihydropteroate synthase
MPNASPFILFVTGRLAEASLRDVVAPLAEQLGFRYEIVVPGIQVAALLHTSLLLKRLEVPEHVDRVILPGWCQGDLKELEARFQKPFERGPRDLHDLPEYFGVGRRRTVDLSHYSTEIIAEINHATRMPLDRILSEARSMVAAGANVIDVGGVPGECSNRITEIVSALRQESIRVSIDSFDRHEVEQAAGSGAELILSCNHSNVDWVSRMGVEVVAIPDTPQDLDSLDRLIERLQSDGTAFRVDPILEPIGMGFTASLERYIRVRQRYPDIPMMMGIGNVTELTEVDSAGVNMILAAVCEDLGIQSVLTTQVINWCRTAVAEFNMARRIVHHAVSARTIPKHLDSSLVMLRDSRLRPMSLPALQQLANMLTDPNFRVFAEGGELHLMNRDGHWHSTDAFRLIEQATKAGVQRKAESSAARKDGGDPLGIPQSIDPGHAFYLGYELARAEIALHLGKQYVQDEPMHWGLLGDLKASSSAAVHKDSDASQSSSAKQDL